MDRGLPVDRFYIEQFLSRYSSDIRGEVLEIGEATYSRRWGGNRVSGFHVLHAVEANPEATIVGDLSSGRNIPVGAFDCIILTQTLPFIYDIHGAVRHCHRALRTHGVVLATLPGISQISRYDMTRWGDYWRFTSLSARMLFTEAFGEANVQVESHGNVLAAVSLLHGIPTEDLTAQELNERDADYEVTITVRAQKVEAHS
ncbi:MAG TPA: methyltransferase domain-containing protein [Tepidisphaeraceae bacterium]|nr:methyltransferase domain-containing protein [Tepidisphaeraceae bacterium]